MSPFVPCSPGLVGGQLSVSGDNPAEIHDLIEYTFHKTTYFPLEDAYIHAVAQSHMGMHGV